MSERKVINKYFPPNYDPTKIPRVKKKDKKKDVRMMAPFNMQCKSCGNYIARATKFNAKKETVEDQTYKSVMVFRFYIKCPRCMQPIVFRTDPKTQEYVVEHGAKENFMALKEAERKAREEAEAEEEEEKINPMKHLENRTKASKQQMEASEQIQLIRSVKYKFHNVDIDAVIQEKRQERLEDGATVLAIESANDDDDIKAERKELLRKLALKREGPVIPTESAAKPAPASSQISSVKRPASSALADLIKMKKKIQVKPKG